MNGFSAADMSTAAANGHAEGYQAGYADAVKAFEVGKPAAAQEAVACERCGRCRDGDFANCKNARILAEASKGALPFVAYAYSKGIDGAESAGRAIESALVASVDAATAWADGYASGVIDERTSDDNIGIAGFGAKIDPARANPYLLAAPAAAAPVDASKLGAAMRRAQRLAVRRVVLGSRPLHRGQRYAGRLVAADRRQPQGRQPRGHRCNGQRRASRPVRTSRECLDWD